MLEHKFKPNESNPEFGPLEIRELSPQERLNITEREITLKEILSEVLKQTQEREQIKSILTYDLDRFPELGEFNEDEIRKLTIHWDDIFVRWLRRFFLPFGIEVSHNPEQSQAPIQFIGIHVLDGDRSIILIFLEPVKDHVVKEMFYKKQQREKLVELYLFHRLKDLEKLSKTLPKD